MKVVGLAVDTEAQKTIVEEGVSSCFDLIKPELSNFTASRRQINGDHVPDEF